MACAPEVGALCPGLGALMPGFLEGRARWPPWGLPQIEASVRPLCPPLWQPLGGDAGRPTPWRGARGLLLQARAYSGAERPLHPGAGRGASPALLPVSCSLPFGVFLKGLKCLPFAPIFFLSQDVCLHPLLPSSMPCSQWGSGGSTVPAKGGMALELGNVTTSSGSGSWTTHTTLPCPKMPS